MIAYVYDIWVDIGYPPITYEVYVMQSNVMKLQVRILSNLAIPNGGGVQDGIQFLLGLGNKDSPSNDIVKEAQKRTQEYILAVRNAADPNPFRNSTDEEIASEILRMISEGK